MKTTIRHFVLLIVVIAVALLTWTHNDSTRAQVPCRSFDAIGQMIIPTSNPLETGHRWGGQIYIKMGDEYVQGLISGDDGLVVRQPSTGHGTDGLYVIGFNCTPGTPHWICEETIRIAVPNSIFGATAPIYEQYQGNSAYIEGGTGRFQYATGNINFSGPYIVWNTPAGPTPRMGRFNPELNGHICGVE
jgi:hypothetical protein